MIRKYCFHFHFFASNTFIIIRFIFRSFLPNDYLPPDCLHGIILRDHLKTILERFQLTDIINNEKEFEKLWSKFDLDNVGMVRTNVFLRLLDYRINLADEIDADIQKLVTRSGAAGIIDRRTSAISASTNASSASKKHRRSSLNKTQDSSDNDVESKHRAPPPTALDQRVEEIKGVTENSSHDEPEKSNKISSTSNSTARELSTKFRTLVQQHRKMVKQLNENDEFLPFFDRKVNRFLYLLEFHTQLFYNYLKLILYS